MNEPNGQEYILDSNPNRLTSIIVRKAPNIVTLVQRTANGVAVVDLSDTARNEMIDLLSGSPARMFPDVNVPDQIPIPTLRDVMDTIAGEPKRRGRPPKAS